MEFKLPQINGEDVARMIRTSKNPNSSTPIVAVTGYLKDLSDPQHFDELMEKPATPSKLIDVLERQCFWKAPASERPAFGLRTDSLGLRSQLHVSDERGRVSPSVERFMAGPRSRSAAPSSSVDEDSVSVVGSSLGALGISRTSDWERPSAISGGFLGNEPESSMGRVLVPQPTPLPILHQETGGPIRLQSHPMERIPSPLSTHVSAGAPDNSPPTSLPSPPEMIPLPPSIQSTPVFGAPTVELLKSPLGRSPPHMPLQRYRAHPLAPADPLGEDAAQTHGRQLPREENRFNLRFPPDDEQQSTSLLLDFNKGKSKRSSLEKKKEKQGKQRKEGLLGEEADADDEDSISGGKKPSKSRSIGEFIRGVKRSPPEIKRTMSSEGKKNDD